MQSQLAFIRYARNGIVNIMDEMSLGQINHVPEGFNNNLVWQLGHLIVALQNYCYINAGLPSMLEESFIERYKNGTKPEGSIDEAEFITMKNLATSTLDQLEKDLQSDTFANFEPKTLGNGIQINSIADALEMMVFHEALHYGEVKILKRLVQA